jgi:glycosyltransferase involved in cell wall biosynthesis
MLFSIIIPTINRSDSLKRTLGSIIKLERRADFEVIVVDNGSIDNTRKICDEYAESMINFRYVYDNEPGLLTGRHRGALEAKGEVFCFLDDDVVLSPGWFKAIVDCCYDDPDVDLFTGPCLPDFESSPPKWLQDFWYEVPGLGRFCSWLSLIDLGEGKKLIDPSLVWGLNFVIRRPAFHELGGFHPDSVPLELQMFQGDGETGLTVKASNAGKKAIYHPGIQLNHVVPKERLTKAYFGKRAFFQGVCDSYTQIRKGGAPISSAKVFIEFSKKFLRSFTRKEDVDLRSPEVKEIRALTEEQYKSGYQFHQRWFKKSPVVREWVLRDNYLDYKLPVI